MSFSSRIFSSTCNGENNERPSIAKSDASPTKEAASNEEKPTFFGCGEAPIGELKVISKKQRCPIATVYIIGSAFCERFAFVGVRTILPLYLQDMLHLGEVESIIFYHLFIMICDFTPIWGAVVADGYIGKFKTILILSFIYALGCSLLSFAAIPDALPQIAFSILSLSIIAMGSGGIEPCVAAFGGDQFIRPQQDKMLGHFFSVFHYAVTAAALLSAFLTPMLRENLQCFDDVDCYSVAFGVPAMFMLVAAIVFASGSVSYKVKKPEGQMAGKIVKCVAHAIKRKLSKSKEKHDHWLDYASDKYEVQLIEDVKQLMRIQLLFLPIPIFWALFDQQGSSWTFQATRMNGSLSESFAIEPDQMQTFNPLMSLLIVPIFDNVIYPCTDKCGVFSPLQRMGVGGFLAGFAFLMAGFLELKLEPTYAVIPREDLTQMNFINTLPCTVALEYSGGNKTRRGIELDPGNYLFERDLTVKPLKVKAWITSDTCGELNVTETKWSGDIEGESQKVFSVIVTLRDGYLQLGLMDNDEPVEKAVSGQPLLRFIIDNTVNGGLIALRSGAKHYTFHFTNESKSTLDGLTSTSSLEVEQGRYNVLVPTEEGLLDVNKPAGEITVLQGGCYTGIVQRSLIADEDDNQVILVEVTKPNSVSILWQVPQYIVITVAEVLFAATGIQMSFIEAPISMRSIMQAVWLLTGAFGNLIDVVLAETHIFPRKSITFFMFAGLMWVDLIPYIILAVRYKYVNDVTTKKTSSTCPRQTRDKEIKEPAEKACCEKD